MSKRLPGRFASGFGIAVLLAALAAPAAAAPSAGKQTRKWLALQRTDTATVAAKRPMPGDVADKVYERYLKSFSHPLPESFNRKRFVEQD